jgi:hypothetical protein
MLLDPVVWVRITVGICRIVGCGCILVSKGRRLDGRWDRFSAVLDCIDFDPSWIEKRDCPRCEQGVNSI